MAAAPSFQVKMAMRVMLRTGLRVSECLSLRPEVTGNKSKKGREVPIPDDLLESLGDMVAMRPRDRQLLLFDVSQQWVSKSMKEVALEAGLGHRSLAETERYVQLAGGHHDWEKRL